MGSWSKATAGTGLTIRSSRDRFAASCKSANFHLHKAAKRSVLTQALAIYETSLASRNDNRAAKLQFE